MNKMGKERYGFQVERRNRDKLNMLNQINKLAKDIKLDDALKLAGEFAESEHNERELVIVLAMLFEYMDNIINEHGGIPDELYYKDKYTQWALDKFRYIHASCTTGFGLDVFQKQIKKFIDEAGYEMEQKPKKEDNL